ncbi:2-succinyl-6-hydroxy-2,4-cyclohexadiene-1-carboxylate synthase [Paraferrimonas haliotis]|uniref:2-succinyl-6-hydroxy-2, 4-cyclohexadiene-1-carboxylate synthase n=1 Tax=Paraferrimonas haliotis TaxID=2013866 RepID=UPI000BA9C940|nr:2-succinyl-6-hydroxy-2,4-cyclohexadiene-1-carboxylate synthase [Paraferrimonas haliotis]
MLTIHQVFTTPSKPKLLLLHGFLGNHRDWSQVLNSLSQGFDVYLVDLPGHGDSGHVSVNDLQQLLKLLHLSIGANVSGPYHLLGYSMGGRLALHYANFCHQHNVDDILSLTLEACHPGLTDSQQQTQRWQSDQNWASRFTNEPMDAVLNDWYLQPVFAELNQQQRQDLIDARLTNNGEALANMMTIMSLANQPNFWDLPQTLNYSVHYLVGALDSKFLGLAQQWQQHSPKLSYHVIADAGHNVHRAQSQAFTQAIQHLLEP